MGYENIPAELRALNQWCVWKYVTIDPSKPPTKVPFHPNGFKADTMNRETYASFFACANAIGYDGIGFIFSKDDPYCGIDLDKIMGQSEKVQEAHKRIYESFNSYSEWSPSGEGMHIIIRASVPTGRNNRSKACEIYSQGRFFTFTGNVINPVPIVDRNDIAQILWNDLASENERSSFIDNQEFERPQLVDDAIVYDRAMQAENGAKFKRLWDGDWQTDYGHQSQSEADFALIDILQYYTKNVDQIVRMFMLSGLGQRDKARQRKGYYVYNMAKRAFDREIQLIDFSEIDNRPRPQIQQTPVETIAPNKNEIVISPFAPKPEDDPMQTVSPFSVPPGLLGEISRFIFSASPRPVAEASIAGAIVMMAGICGKAYNVSGTGLNQYLLYLAPTATGKEAIASGISKLMTEISYRVPSAGAFFGPSDMASGQGLLRYIQDSETKSFFSVIGEFGLRMQTMASDRASPSEKALERCLLDIYTKSGETDVFNGTTYAQRDNNIKKIAAPAMSLLGESIPSRFFSAIDENTVISGLLPRFTIIEYNGPRVDENKFHYMAKPTDTLITQLSDITAICLGRIAQKQVCHVPLSNDVFVLDDEFNKWCDTRINSSVRDVIKALWSRTRLTVLKLAALVAVGKNPYEPVVDAECYNWAKSVVVYEAENLSKKFVTGRIVANNDDLEGEQLLAVLKMLDKWLNSRYVATKTTRTTPEMHDDGIFILSDIQMRCNQLAVFRRDNRKDMAQKMGRAIETMKQLGMFTEVNFAMPQFAHHKTKARAIRLADYNIMLEYIRNAE